jgi:hypothetical protein
LEAPCTAGADSFFVTDEVPHCGQGGFGSLIFCSTVKSCPQDSQWKS